MSDVEEMKLASKVILNEIYEPSKIEKDPEDK